MKLHPPETQDTNVQGFLTNGVYITSLYPEVIYEGHRAELILSVDTMCMD